MHERDIIGTLVFLDIFLIVLLVVIALSDSQLTPELGLKLEFTPTPDDIYSTPTPDTPTSTLDDFSSTPTPDAPTPTPDAPTPTPDAPTPTPDAPTPTPDAPTFDCSTLLALIQKDGCADMLWNPICGDSHYVNMSCDAAYIYGRVSNAIFSYAEMEINLKFFASQGTQPVTGYGIDLYVNSAFSLTSAGSSMCRSELIRQDIKKIRLTGMVTGMTSQIYANGETELTTLKFTYTDGSTLVSQSGNNYVTFIYAGFIHSLVTFGTQQVFSRLAQSNLNNNIRTGNGTLEYQTYFGGWFSMPVDWRGTPPAFDGILVGFHDTFDGKDLNEYITVRGATQKTQYTKIRPITQQVDTVRVFFLRIGGMRI